MLGLAFICLCGSQMYSQQIEGIYKLPSVAVGSTLSSDLQMRYIEFGMYEVGVYYKNILGLSLGRSRGYGRQTGESAKAWNTLRNAQFGRVLFESSSSNMPSVQTTLKLFKRVVDGRRFTLEPHAGITFFRTFPLFIKVKKGRYMESDRSISLIEPVRNALGARLGVLAEFRINDLGIFCNVVWKQQPTSHIVGLRRHEAGKLEPFRTQRQERAAWYLELGLRVRIQKPFSWLKIK